MNQTLRRTALAGLAMLSLAASLVAFAARDEDGGIGRFKTTIADWECIAVINELSTQATYALNPREADDEDAFEVELEGLMQVKEFTGSVTVLDPAEIIAVSKDLQVRSAKTRLKSDALKEKPREARNEPNYSPVHPEGAEFRVRRLELKVPPHRLEEMILRGSVLLAEQRKHIDLPAAVMDEPAEGPRGAKLRISSMSIRRGRSNRPDTMSMSIEWEQNKQVGPALRDFVFVDKVFALDKEGRIIGGGRWNRGDPLNESGTFKFDIDLPASQACQTIRVDMVTKYSEQDFDLTIEDIFDPRER